MKTPTASFLITGLLVVSQAGCSHRECVRRYFQTMSVEENRVGAIQGLNLCKGGRSPGQFDVNIGSTKSVLIATVQTNDRESRYDGSCSDYYTERDKTEHVPVALTSKSFDTVKLCYKDTARTAIHLVAKSDFCPVGTIEQATPIDICSQL